ncbi:MAG: hypothetical protein KY397_05185 [Gemmatimonadetes bacterium]|nr:hypothetical protein [Gemmatimonadota bacterium]
MIGAAGSPTTPDPRPDAADRPDPVTPLEGAGWALLALLTLVILLLAVLRPTDPRSIVSEIRLAAGFDRYEAAMEEGERLYATAIAEFRVAGDDAEARRSLFEMLARSAERFQRARSEAEGFHEDQRAQVGIARTHYVWARELLKEGDRPWYRSDDTETLRRARDIVDEALALPSLPGGVRVDLEELGTRIDRAITPWPIL